MLVIAGCVAALIGVAFVLFPLGVRNRTFQLLVSFGLAGFVVLAKYLMLWYGPEGLTDGVAFLIAILAMLAGVIVAGKTGRQG